MIELVISCKPCLDISSELVSDKSFLGSYTYLPWVLRFGYCYYASVDNDDCVILCTQSWWLTEQHSCEYMHSCTNHSAIIMLLIMLCCPVIVVSNSYSTHLPSTPTHLYPISTYSSPKPPHLPSCEPNSYNQSRVLHPIPL